MPFKVYRVIFFGAVRNHHALFVQFDDEKTGHLIHVTGDIQVGMDLEIEVECEPQLSLSYISQELIGTVQFGGAKAVLDMCVSTVPPGIQMNLLGMKIHPDRPFRRCEDWVDEVIENLKSEGILVREKI